MILPKQHIIEGKLFADIKHESQYQPCGCDLTLKEAYVYTSAGLIDFDNSSRRLSTVEPIPFNNDEVRLRPGAYKIVYGEYVKIPKDAAAFVYPRSSLLRCGATVESAVWDPGYEGRGEAMLVVHNSFGITLKRHAKVAQMVFTKLVESTTEEYAGVYKGENK